MGTHRLLLLIFLFVASIVESRYVLLWSDEFEGSSVDSSKWVFEQGNNNGWGNAELECYTGRSQNAFIQNGNLVIQALKENYGGCSYTSARMKTQGKFSVLYGVFEMRAKLPFGQGMWPAFWLLGDNIDTVGWPACGEIDIMELVGKDPKNVHGSTHGVGFGTTSSYYFSKGFSNDYHNYSVNWQPDRVEFSVDGNAYNVVTPSSINASWPFNNEKMFILLNLAVGGYWPGSPDSTTQFPQQYTIDYVRVYEWAQ